MDLKVNTKYDESATNIYDLISADMMQRECSLHAQENPYLKQTFC